MNPVVLAASFPEQIAAWWQSLEISAQIFYVLGGAALVVVVVQALLTLFGGDSAPDDAFEDGGVGLISVRTTTAFFMGFGLCGGQLLEAGTPLLWTLCGSVGTGVVFLLLIFAVMKMLHKMRSSGNIRLESAKNSTGTVYVGIPAGGKSGGQIEVMISGRVMTFPAVTKSEKNLPAGTLVRIVEILPNNHFVVEPAE